MLKATFLDLLQKWRSRLFYCRTHCDLFRSGNYSII